MENTNKSDELDRDGRLMIIALALIQSILLLLAYYGIKYDWAWFAAIPVRTLWLTLAVAVPTFTSLLLRRGRDHYAAIAAAVLIAVLLPLAWHGGNACGARDIIACDGVWMPYVVVLTCALFVALPFVQTARDHGPRLSYPDLFHHAWDNWLALHSAALFAGAGWLILVLWAGLFKLIGIGFFTTLFSSVEFIFPVSGLFFGFGLMLCRTQPGALRAVLRVWLSLSRGLLPLIGTLAVVFLLALTFTGLQPLWATRYAATLLLTLVLATVTLANAAFQDGVSGPPPSTTLRRLVAAALLTLPAYAGIAAYALSLRVDQYGWSVDRLWAALISAFAMLYAFGYAAAVLRRSDAWLSLIAPVSAVIGLLLSAVLLLTQSTLLDFRVIAVNSQLAQLDKGAVTLEKFDLTYLRWNLGRPGVEALQALSKDARVKAAPDVASRIQKLLVAKNRWEGRENEQPTLAAKDFLILPKGAAVPDGVLAALNEKQKNRIYAAEPCARKAQSCALLQVDLNGDAQAEWVLINKEGRGYGVPVLALRGDHWQQVGNLNSSAANNAKDVLKTLEDAAISTEPQHWKDLRIGTLLLHFQPTAQPP